MTDDRFEDLKVWLADALCLPTFDIQAASGDASFRRYFRVRYEGHSVIAVDAPPGPEDSQPFIAVARLFDELGVNVPKVLEADLERGFMLLSDLGTRLYLDELGEDSVARLYGDALSVLMVIQACGPQDDTLPPYDHALLLREMALFGQWFLKTHLKLELSAAEQALLDKVYENLAYSALEQPRVCVHRDYHSRNLLVTEKHNPGILDFQDAVIGPITYDLVSLLRDCYIAWPRKRVEDWAIGYHELALQSGVLQDDNAERFLRWFDWMGVQRHLKATGIFARLNHRDAKPDYLRDIPRTLGYVEDVTRRYPELADFYRFLMTRVLPQMRRMGL